MAKYIVPPTPKIGNDKYRKNYDKIFRKQPDLEQCPYSAATTCIDTDKGEEHCRGCETYCEEKEKPSCEGNSKTL